jgi:histone-lysine N-methyltransferase SETMAR
MHLDNCRVHRSKASENYFAEKAIIRIPHPPYSPDLIPSDFWLFRYMKAALAGQQFPVPADLLTGIQEFLGEIQKSELERVFHHSIERVQWILDND